MGNNLVIKVFGSLDVSSGGQSLDLTNSRKTRALIAILALETAPISREKLCDLLWDIPDDPRGALRWSLSKIRSALGAERDALLATRESVALDRSRIDCDWDHLSIGIADRQNLSTSELLSLHNGLSGDFLETLSLPKCPAFESWKLFKGEQSRRWRIELMKTLLVREDIDQQKAIDIGRQLIQLAPEDESSHLALVQRLAASGYQQEAAQQLQISKEVLADLSSGLETRLLDSWQVDGKVAKPAIQPDSDKTQLDHRIHDGPSIAVLPFVDQPGAGENNYLALGMTEDITTLLSQVPNLAVIAPDSTLSYIDKRPDIKTISAELGVRYVLTGTVRKIGESLRLTVRLVDTLSFKNLWSDKQDRPLADIFDLQDEMINGIVGSIGNELVRAEINRAKLAPPDTLNAWETVAKATYYYYHGFSRSSVERAITLCHSAIKLMPEYAPAHSLLAFNLATSVANQFTNNVAEAGEQAIKSARVALNLDSDNSLVVCHWGAVNSYLGEFDMARKVLL